MEGEIRDAYGNVVKVTDVPIIYGPAVEELEQLLKPTDVVLEYGSGGSTVWFAQRVKKVYALEDSCEWGEAVAQSLLDRGLHNAEVTLMPIHGACRQPPPSMRIVYPPDGPEGEQYEAFARLARLWPDGTFDLVLVDATPVKWGDYRIDCCHEAIAKLRQGGWLILDDANRAIYKHLLLEFDGLGWPHFDVNDPQWPGPGVRFWRKP